MARSRGVVPLVSAAALVGVCLWIAASVFEPFQQSDGTFEYVFVSASFWRLGIFVVAAAGGVALLEWFSRQGFFLRHRVRTSISHVGVVGWMALPLLPLLYLPVPALGQFPAISYVLVDLRWAWWLTAVAVLIWRLAPGPLTMMARHPSVTRGVGLVVLVALPIASAIIFTPNLRFTSALHGDEPKYLRYCENFFQGLGFDVASQRTLTQPGVDDPHVLNNFRELARAVPVEARLLLSDVERVFGAQVPPRLLAHEPTEGMFFAGKHAGTVYQLHNPGISLLLFPGYYVDRRWTGSGLGYRDEFPASLPAVYTILLALYAGYGLAAYALLRACGLRRPLSWGLALMTLCVMPVSAFAFQIYPEVAAGIIVCLVTRHLMLNAASRLAPDLAFGLLAGFLPWLHVRLAVVAIVLALWGLFGPGRSWRRGLPFAAGAAAGCAAICLYTYRLTGSLLPSSTYGSEAPLSMGRLLLSLPGFAFDRTWGVLPHAPIYLLAIPGITLLWMRRRALASWLLMLFGAVALPAAGHGYWAGGATPGRYLVAAMPIAVVFLAEAASRWTHRRLFVAVSAALTLISVETAFRYDFYLQKEIGRFVASGFAGWRLNLLFPSIGMQWNPAPTDGALLAAWTAVAAGLLLWPIVRGRMLASRPAAREIMHSRGTDPWDLFDLFGVFTSLAAIAIVVSQLTGDSVASAYLVPAKDAKENALRMFASQPTSALYYSSRLGAVEPTRALGNDPSVVVLQVTPQAPIAGQTIRVRARPRSTTGDYLVGDVIIDLGDGHTEQSRRLFGDLNVDHVYDRSGRYHLHATFSTAERTVTADLEVIVRAGVVPQS